MRVVFLTWRDSTHPDGGGSEVYVEQVARRLAARGHDVLIRCAAHPGAAARVEADGVRLHRFGGRLTVYPRGLLWLALRGRRTDVVVDVINGLPFGAPLVRRGGVVALVHHVHREQWHIIYPRLWGHVGWFVEGRLTPRLYRRRPHLTVSAATAADLVDLGVPADAITIARNGGPPDPRPSSAPAAPESASPRLVVLARLVPHKQVEHALRVLRDLGPQVPGLELDVIGDGWWRGELEAYAAQLGLEDVVRMHGRVPDDERDELLARAWVHLLPSVREGWGLAVSEAARQETPTVAYRQAGGTRESVLDGVSGLLVDDEWELATAVRTLLGDPGLRRRLGKAARVEAAQLDWERTVDLVEALLDEVRDARVLSGRRRRGRAARPG